MKAIAKTMEEPREKEDIKIKNEENEEEEEKAKNQTNEARAVQERSGQQGENSNGERNEW